MTGSGASWVARGKDAARAGVRGVLHPVVSLLARLGVSPDHVTWTGLLVTMAGGVLFGAGRFVAGSLVALVGCLLDSVDGSLARMRGGETRWGAFLDSTTDRIADAALFLGVAAYYARQPLELLTDEDQLMVLQMEYPPPVAEAIRMAAFDDWLTALAAIAALVGAFLVSYTRARAEGLGLECRVGWFERPERLVVLLGAGLFGAASPVMPWALVVLAVLSFFTAFQRVAHVRKQLSTPAV
ncbi:MAG: CDP-alcohol phosphatidyltransferase family protein [Candidatus Eiseniibacteriota bacterium]